MTAIDGISFNVKESEFLTIVGPSGCGKSTLLNMIAGLVPSSKGTITVFGQKVTEPIKNAGYVFQNPVLMQWRNVLQNVLLPIELLHQDKRKYLDRANELINLVGLSTFERRRPRELSGGMQQRVAIARALIHDPSLLLMDEPFGSLDEYTREQMVIELLKITEKMKKTVIFVTHSVDEAILLGDRVIVLSPRPATIKSDIQIDLPRPRAPSIKGDSKYVKYCQDVRQLLGLA